jgi:hypothetical protein
MFVPGGEVAGMGLMSFDADVVIQKATPATSTGVRPRSPVALAWSAAA